MKTITINALEHDYPGDADWYEYVSLYRSEYLDENALLLAKAFGDRLDESLIIYGKRGLSEGLWWIERSVPALDGLRPLDCLGSRVLIKRLRSALMRMP